MCHPLILILLDQTSGCVITYDILSGWTQEVEHSWYSVNAAQVAPKRHIIIFILKKCIFSHNKPNPDFQRRQFWQQGLTKPPAPPTAESGLIFRQILFLVTMIIFSIFQATYFVHNNIFYILLQDRKFLLPWFSAASVLESSLARPNKHRLPRPHSTEGPREVPLQCLPPLRPCCLQNRADLHEDLRSD